MRDYLDNDKIIRQAIECLMEKNSSGEYVLNRKNGTFDYALERYSEVMMRRFDDIEFLAETKYTSDIITSCIKYIKRQDDESSEDLCESIYKSICCYFKAEFMERVIEISDEMYHDDMNKMGYMERTDKDNGEKFYSKERMSRRNLS